MTVEPQWLSNFPSQYAPLPGERPEPATVEVDYRGIEVGDPVLYHGDEGYVAQGIVSWTSAYSEEAEVELADGDLIETCWQNLESLV